MRISTRIWLAIVASAVATAVSVGVITNHYIETAILPVALNHLQSESQRLLDRLGADIFAVRGDVIAGQSVPAVELVMRHTDQSGHVLDAEAETVWKDRVARYFTGQISAKPAYLRMCVIEAANGREVVSVERSSQNGEVRVVPVEGLREVADRDYFAKTLALVNGEHYVSDITSSSDHGTDAAETWPSIIVSAPITDENGAKLGIFVITVDMRPYFAQLQPSKSVGARFYVLNDSGAYVLHPDDMRAEAALSSSFANEFPLLAANPRDEGVRVETLTTISGERIAAAMVSARLGGGPLISIIETLPIEVVMAPARDARKTAFAVGGIAAIVGTFLAYWVGRSLSRPMDQLTRSLTSFHAQQPIAPPTNAAGEIGAAARAFEETAAQIREKSGELRMRLDELHQTEAELRSQIERAGHFGAALEHAHEAIFTMRLDGTITAWNAAAERLFGYTQEEAIGGNASIIIPHEHHSELRLLTTRLGEGQTAEVLETVRLHKDGTRVLVSQTASPVMSGQDEVIGVAVIMRSVAEERNAEAVRLALEAMPDATIMVDPRGHIVLVNTETERLFGYERNELIGETIELLVPTRFRFRHREVRGEFEKSPRIRCMSQVAPLAAMRKDGTEFNAEISLHPIMMQNGRHVMSVVRDVTERLESQSAIQRYTEELRRSNADLEQFAYIASHDLQEPLRMVASYTELLAQRYAGKLDDTADKYIHFAVDGARRMKELINALLDYARVDKHALHTAPTSMTEIVQSAVTSLEPLIAESNAEVTFEDLPSVEVDPTLITLLLQNLIGNAIKFRSELRPKVKITSMNDGDMCVVSIEDNGIGIEEKFGDRIFQMFQRLHARDKYKGNGIGLAVARKIVERHGGKIWFTSRPLFGTTFSFTLPLTREK